MPIRHLLLLTRCQPAFKEDSKWRLSDGDSTISARIFDLDLPSGVNADETAFATGDVLICEVKVTQWHAPSGAKTDYDVTRVVEHRHAATQISFRACNGHPGLVEVSRLGLKVGLV